VTTTPSTNIRVSATESRRIEIRLDEGGELRLEVALHRGPVTDLPFDRDATFEEDHGGDAHDAQAHRRLRVGVDVHLEHLGLDAELAGDVLDYRGDHAAGPAPLSPEVDQDRLVGFQNGLLELGVGYGSHT